MRCGVSSWYYLFSVSYEGITVLNYRLGRKLGEGGFGVVHAAEHVQLGRSAAVKVLRSDYRNHGELVERFFREARLVCDIGHAAVVEVHNSGTLETGEPFYLMELVEGRALGDILSEDGPLSALDALAVFAPVADALAAAHASGVIHRDLKPSNIMLRRTNGRVDQVKLLDFGIAKLLDAVDDLSSATGSLMGTPAYMAPEQARDAKSVDARADVYSFAATVFSALCARKPFDRTNVAELLLAVQTEVPPRLSSLRGGVPRRLDKAIEHCMSKRRDQRPSSIEQAWAEIQAGLREVEALTPIGVAHPVSPRTGLSAQLAPTMASTLTEAASSHAPTKVRRRATGVWVVALVVGVAAVGTFVVASSSHGEGDPGGHAISVADAAPTALAPGADAAAPPSTPEPAIADPADAAPPPDGPPPDAAPPRRSHPRRSHRVRPPPVPPPAAPEPAPEPERPALTCTTASFAKVWRAEQPSPQAVKAALSRLRACEQAGELDAVRFQQYQRALLRKL